MPTSTLPDQQVIPRNQFGLNEPIEKPTEPSLSPFEQYLKEQRDIVMDFQTARIHLNRLVDDWKNEITLTEERRLKRDVEIDVESLRQEGRLDEDETLLPKRIIDTNIQREQPPYINYLKNSRRLAIFNCISNPDQKVERLELEFTRGLTYPSWETPHFKCLDGAQTHGWDAVEVVYDESLSLHVGLEHVGHDKLFFPMTNPDIQNAGRIVRAYDVTSTQLKRFVVKNGFSADQVGIILQAKEDTKNKSETTRIYKKYCKYEGKVYVAWFALDQGVSDWLKAPAPLYLGIKDANGKDAPVTDYPIYLLYYRETEKPKITDHKGRVFLDEYEQEAMTSLQSSYVNGMYRATQIYASQEEDGTGSSLKEISDVVMHGNRVLNKKVNFFHVDYPDPSVIKALSFFNTENSEETGQVNFAAVNRQDSRKTAKEITSSEQQQALLNSVQLTLFSTYIRGIYNLVWLIVQSQALQGKIKFLQIKVPKYAMSPIGGVITDPTTGQPVIEGEQWVNDQEAIVQVYDVRAAGDVDVIQRAEKLQQMQQDWPVVSQTVLKDVFLAEMLRLRYPDTGDRWVNILTSQGTVLDQAKGLVRGFSTIIETILKTVPGVNEQLDPASMQAIQQLLASSAQLNEPPKQ